jgi:hypothetical protein
MREALTPAAACPTMRALRGTDMRTGDCSTTTGLYRSDCACRSLVQIRRAADAPVCPKCRKPVGWTFQRSTYMKGPPEVHDTKPSP